MVDFSAFDSILDAAFVVSDDGKVVYCNDAAATLCATSVRRVTNKVILSDLIEVEEPNIFPFSSSSMGRNEPTPFIETSFKLLKGEKNGRVQMAIRPLNNEHWVFFLRDVSLEEALHSKYRSELAQKEEYAKNLEKLVEARTRELRLVNQTLKAILNSLGQGFFTFDAHGACGDVFTRACQDILETSPAGHVAWEVLRVPELEVAQFKTWIDSTFKELLPFDDMKALGPSLFHHSHDRYVTLEYYPVRREEEEITDVVVVATDKTSERNAQLALESERQYAAMIIKYIKNKDQFLQFLQSVKKALQELDAISDHPMKSQQIAESFRTLHTLEGEAGTFSILELRRLTRECQQVLEPYKTKLEKVEGSALKTYQVALKKLSAGFEKFLMENREVFTLPSGEVSRSIEVPLATIHELLRDLGKIPAAEGLTARFEEQLLKVPIEASLRYFDGLVQGVAEKLGKKIKPISIIGGEIRIFPEPYRPLFSSMVHAFRNAVDHGLEMPDEREWAGKDPAGQINVRVTTDSGRLLVHVHDDGKGIDPVVIREKLKNKFPDQNFTNQTDDEIIQQVCMPGFSSRDEVGEFSGRGVGLDALREEVLKLGGSLRIQSIVGQGTDLLIDIPEVGLKVGWLRSA